MTTIGFLGVGHIGLPMAERLLAAGHDVSFHARRPEAVRRLHLLGGRPVDSPIELAAQEMVIGCLFDDVQLLAVAPAIIDSMRPGSIFVSHTTGTTMALDRLAAVAGTRSVAVVDAGFSGSREAVVAGTLTLFLGGADDDVDRAGTVLAAYGSVLVHAGALGAGMRVKVLNNLLFAAVSQVTLSVVVSAAAIGVGEASALRALRAGSGSSAVTDLIQSCGGAAAFMARVEPYLRKDVDVALQMADAANVDLGAALATATIGPMNLTGQR